MTRDDAFRLVMGLPVPVRNVMQVWLRRPYDFLVITDRAEYMGEFSGQTLKVSVEASAQQ